MPRLKLRQARYALRTLHKSQPEEGDFAGWLEWIRGVALACETVAAHFDIANERAGEWTRKTDPWLVGCRNVLENRRVRTHWASCVPLSDDHEGLTVDSLSFLAVCVCDYVRQWVCFSAALVPQPPPRELPFYDVHVSDLSPTEMDITFGSLFHHRRHMDIEEAVGVLRALHSRCSCLLGGFCLELAPDPGEFNRRRIQWSCAVARMRIGIERQLASPTYPPPVVRTHPAHIDVWMRAVIPAWLSSRFRESVIRAMHNRDARADEVGTVTGMRDSAPQTRANATVELQRSTVYALDYDEFLSLPEDDRVGTIVELRDIILLRLVSNALMEIGTDFLQYHLVLDSVKEAVTPVVHTTWRVVELMCSWALVSPRHVTLGTGTLDEVLAAWYDAQFPDTDPLGVHGTPALDQGLVQPMEEDDAAVRAPVVE